MPSATVRSERSDRSSPAQKCWPSPLMTSACAEAGRWISAVCSCCISASLMALRLAGRFRRMWATAPLKLICSSFSWASRPSAGVNSGVMVLMGVSGKRS